MLIRYIQVKMQAIKLVTYAPMTTPGHVSSQGLKKTCFTKPGCRKYQPHFQLVSMLLEMSAAKQVQKNKHMLKSRARFD